MVRALPAEDKNPNLPSQDIQPALPLVEEQLRSPKPIKTGSTEAKVIDEAVDKAVGHVIRWLIQSCFRHEAERV